MRYKPDDVKWEVLPTARKVHERLHAHLPPEISAQSIAGLREILCGYFSSSQSCDEQTKSIAPMGSARGGRAFKVRWSVPGRGKSGGLRLAVVAFCPTKHLIIAGAWARATDPDDAEFHAACEDLDED